VSFGREGHMIAEVAARAARQNVLYLELMQSWGMDQARELAGSSELFDGTHPLTELLESRELVAIVDATLKFLDRAERQWREVLGCAADANAPGCKVEIRYLAQVIRAFPPEYVLAQTLLAFKLVEADERYVGLNFVAPEDNPYTLRDYTLQMQIIRDVGALFPELSERVTLHAGELALPLVAPEELTHHISEAVHIAGAKRIGHGVDVIYENNAIELLQHMARQQILVEINLTSNAVILGVEGADHPFDLYRSFNVPLALSTDDEGVTRIDLTHEYTRAVQSYDVTYSDLKELSRNALAYSFLPGASLFAQVTEAQKIKNCAKDGPSRGKISSRCRSFLESSEKARLQWQLEQRFLDFEATFQ
jgi:adenosine deaminase